MTMAKQNTKHTRKSRLTKAKKEVLAKKLEQTVKNVSRKGLYFKRKTKTNEYQIVDGKTKEVVLDEILLVESANQLLKTMNNANQKQITKLIPSYRQSLERYQGPIQKHLNDLMFYKHTLKTTQSKVLFFSTEARVDLSLMYLRKARAELHNKLDVNSLHGIHLT